MFLLDRGYPRKGALALVGNRYQLNKLHRNLLHRGIFSQKESSLRRNKLLPVESIKSANLGIDGYNVMITIESALRGLPLIEANDGVVRDVAEVSGQYKVTETTNQALEILFDLLWHLKPAHILILLDAPIRFSGIFASKLREMMKNRQMVGDALAVKVPERYLMGFEGIVATSDSALIDQSEKVVDLAGHIVRVVIRHESLVSL